MSLRFFHLDLISEKPCLYYNSYRRFTNLCGLLGTLLAFILIFANALACFIIWVKGHDISVITTIESKDFSSKMNLSHTIFFYKLIESDGSLVDPNVATVVPTLWVLDDEKTTIEILLITMNFVKLSMKPKKVFYSQKQQHKNPFQQTAQHFAQSYIKTEKSSISQTRSVCFNFR